MKLFCLLGALLLTGCAHNIDAQQFSGPNGRAAFTMDCGAKTQACYQKAGELCPGGYNIVDRASGTVAVPVYGGGFIAAPRHSLTIECK